MEIKIARRSLNRTRAYACLACLAVVVHASTLHADALDRLRPEKLKAVHEAIESLKSQKRDVSLRSGYDDVRACIHVHSLLSHDSRASIEEIIAGAKAAGVRVIMFSEHPANHYDYFVDGHRGPKDGVLLIPGAETGGFLAYPRQSIQKQTANSPQALSDLIRSTGGQSFVCHLEERLDWSIANVTGMEMYNTHADIKGEERLLETLQSPIALLGMVGLLKQYPQEFFGSLLDYPADYLKRYDELCQVAPHTGIAGNDSHHNVGFCAKVTADGKVLVEDRLGEKIAALDPNKMPPIKLLTAGKKTGDTVFEIDLDPYDRSFRHVSTHLLLKEISETAVRQALDVGRAYVSFDWLADPTGFVFQAQSDDNTWPMGSEPTIQKGLRLKAEAPFPGRFKLIRDGSVVLDESVASINFLVNQPGVYRVEVWLNLAGEKRPWILSNPIYVRP